MAEGTAAAVVAAAAVVELRAASVRSWVRMNAYQHKPPSLADEKEDEEDHPGRREGELSAEALVDAW